MRLHPDFTYNGHSPFADGEIPFLSMLDCSAEDWEREHAQFMRSWLSPEKHVQVQTSGSTGDPQILSVAKEIVEASATMTGRHFACLTGTRALLCLPSGYIAGKMMLVRAMTLGWKLDAIAPSSHPLNAIEESYDFAAFTPMQLADLSERELRRFAAIRTVIVGGAAVSPALRSQLTARGNEVFETYGMAETLSHVAVRRFAEQELPFEALPGVRFKTDDDHRLILSAKHLSHQEISTQDVVELIDDRHFYYRGRFDNVINSGGIKLFPEVIERKLQPALEWPFYIGAEQDALLGQRVVLYIETTDSLDEQQLLNRCKELLDTYEAPKAVRVLFPFQRTESGKIKRMNTM